MLVLVIEDGKAKVDWGEVKFKLPNIEVKFLKTQTRFKQ